MKNQKKARSAAAGAAVAAVAAAILLFSADGTAHAGDLITDVRWDPTLGVGLMVRVFGHGPAECHYTATPVAGKNPLNLPAYQHDFFMPASDPAEFSWPLDSFGTGLPAVATGTTWNVVTECRSTDEPGQSAVLGREKVF
jgi:hypothetical protein